MQNIDDITRAVSFISKRFNCNLTLHQLIQPQQKLGLKNLPSAHENYFCMYTKKQYPNYNNICFVFDGRSLPQYFHDNSKTFAVKRCPMGVIELAFAIKDGTSLLGMLFVGPFKSSEADVTLDCGKLYECPKSTNIKDKLPTLNQEDFADLKALCILLIARLLLIYRENTTGQMDYKSKIENFIIKNLHSSFGPEDLAQELGLSLSRTYTLVLKNFDKSLVKVVSEYRVEEAKNLLSSTSFSIDYIANWCGFTDSSYFHRVFKKYTGKTPSQFR